MSKQIYAGTMSAQNIRGVTIAPTALLAHNETEALGLALQTAYQRYPSNDGWISHQIGVVLVPDEMVQEYLQERSK